MDAEQMYHDFRGQYTAMSQAADAKHAATCDIDGSEVKALWFESLANALNDRMGHREHHAQIAAIFKYFDMKFRTGDADIKNFIDVCFVENLFWQVTPKNAAPVWALLPKNLQTLYVSFHGRPPK